VLAAFDLEKNVFVATSAAIDSGVDFSRMIVYLRGGYLTRDLYWFVPGLLLVAFAGSYVGKVLLNKIQQQSFRKIVLLLILVIGLTTLGRLLTTSHVRSGKWRFDSANSTDFGAKIDLLLNGSRNITQNEQCLVLPLPLSPVLE
jgi:hypothetical protein